jgi:FkbM family methyltransferase
MSVADFARMTAGRFKTADQPGDAALDTLAELGVGLRARWHYLASRPTGVTTCRHLGTTFEWRVDSIGDARRGVALHAEEPIARWFFAGDLHDELVWDVGAHQGNYACLAAALGARVRGFEPTPGGYARCVENLEANGHDPARAGGPTAVDPARAADRTTVDQRALSDHSADGTTATVPECSNTASIADDSGTYEAPVAAGDRIAETPDRIKIDVEGHEHAVLRGLTETLPDVERVVVEVHGGDGQGCLDILQAAGFKLREVPCSRPHTFLGAWRA